MFVRTATRHCEWMILSFTKPFVLVSHVSFLYQLQRCVVFGIQSHTHIVYTDIKHAVNIADKHIFPVISTIISFNFKPQNFTVTIISVPQRFPERLICGTNLQVPMRVFFAYINEWKTQIFFRCLLRLA